MKNRAILPITAVICIALVLLAQTKANWLNKFRHNYFWQDPPSASPLNSSTAKSMAVQWLRSNFSRAERCILYDRPPRTGSTTISHALLSCLRHKRYGNAFTYPREVMVRAMLNITAKRRASVKGHLSMTLDDVNLIEDTCEKFFYVTSISSMTDRLFSQIKYGMFTGHGNQTIDLTALYTSLSKRSGEKMNAYELFLEMYPYSVNDTDVTEETRLQPHYIISKENLEHDTRELLDALGCQNISVESDNIHEIVVDSDTLPTAVADIEAEEDEYVEDANITDPFEALRANITSRMVHGDRRYRKLIERAQTQNKIGLELAKIF